MGIKSPVLATAEVYCNADKVIRWHIWNADRTAYEDIGGWTLSFLLARNQGGAAILTKTVAIEDSVTGLVKVDLDPTDTVSLGPGNYYYNLMRTNSGLIDSLADGKFVLKPRIA